MLNIVILLLLGYFNFVKCGESDQISLVFASLLYRHGDRSPIHTFPDDNVPDSYWYEGLGQLSKTGMHQTYLLGKFFHKRYADELKCSFLFNNYTRTQIYVRSTDVDRTLMSAQCQLAGLFMPNDEQVFVQELKWQPIPIHTVPVPEDTLLRASNCPRIDQLDDEVKSSADYKKANDDNKAFFQFLADKTGLPSVSLENVKSVGNTVYIQALNDAPFSWANETVIDDLDRLSNLVRLFKVKLKEKVKLYIGSLIGNIAGEMATMAKASHQRSGTLYPGEKIHIYSAHDNTIIQFLAAFDAFNGSNPGYCSTVVVELYKDTKDEYFVEMWYKSGPLLEITEGLRCNSSSAKNIDRTSECLAPILIPGCAQRCPLSSFQKLISEMVPVNREKECQLQQPVATPVLSYLCNYRVSIVLWLFNIAIGLFLLVKCYKNFRAKKHYRQERMVYSQLMKQDDDEEEELDNVDK